MKTFAPDLFYDSTLQLFFVEAEDGTLVEILSKNDYLQMDDDEKRDFRRRYGVRKFDMDYLLEGYQ